MSFQDDLVSIIREAALDFGASLVSCAALPITVKSAVPGMDSVIAYAVTLNPEIVRQVAEGPTEDYCREYDRVNRLLGTIGDGLCSFLREQGVSASKPPEASYDDVSLRGPFSLRAAAVASGLGWIGKTDMFVCEDYGAAVRLGAVFTAARFPLASIMESRCGDCQICADVCPASASKRQTWKVGMARSEIVEIHQCLAQLYRFGSERKLSHSLCGICFARCRYTQRWLKTQEKL